MHLPEMRRWYAHVLSLAGVSRGVFERCSVSRHSSGPLMIGSGRAREAEDKPAGRKWLTAIPVQLRRLAMWLMLAATVAGCAGGASGSRPAGHDSTAQRSATAFLAAYVRPDGRVYRPDQGGDTVSEGQAYGLLLAEFAALPVGTDLEATAVIGRYNDPSVNLRLSTEIAAAGCLVSDRGEAWVAKQPRFAA